MKLLSGVLLVGLSGCAPSAWQTTPPQLMAAVVDGETRELALEFDKPVDQAAVDGDVGAARVDGPRVTAKLADNLTPGKRYGWSAEVQDAAGNQTSVAGRFYGPNNHPASLRLNEVRIAGAGEHTDFVELLAVAAGSLGGWTLDAYSAPAVRQRLILPDAAVSAGELIVIRYRGVSDTRDAREFQQPEGRGLSASRGLLVLRPAPSASPSEGLLYAKTAGEGAPLAEAAGWPAREELNPDECTPTRTWNRRGEDWFVAANGGATPGQPNGSKEWGGPTSPKKTPKPNARTRRRWSEREEPYGRGSTSSRERRARPPFPLPSRAASLRARTERPPKTSHSPPRGREVRPPTPKPSC